MIRLFVGERGMHRSRARNWNLAFRVLTHVLDPIRYPNADFYWAEMNHMTR